MGHCRLPCRHHENYLEPSSEIEEETEKMGNKNRKKQQCRKKKEKKGGTAIWNHRFCYSTANVRHREQQQHHRRVTPSSSSSFSFLVSSPLFC